LIDAGAFVAQVTVLQGQQDPMIVTGVVLCGAFGSNATGLRGSPRVPADAFREMLKATRSANPLEKDAVMMELNNDADVEEQEEAPNEFVIKRRIALSILAAGSLTSVSSLLSPALGQTQRTFTPGNVKDAAEVGDFLGGLPQCRISTATVEGPYFIDQRIIRSDIRENQPGVPLELELHVANANASCRPVKGAVVSIWHCNAQGEYSGYLFNDPNKLPDLDTVNELGHVQEKDTERWLRGAQTTDADGKVTFQTIVPGWYTPRAAHIHVRAFLSDKTMMTTQLYFPQALSNTIQSTHEYYKSRGVSIYTNENDVVRAQSGIFGTQDILKVSAKPDGSLRATMVLAGT
jgi:protocatechuate 3,4-dioxygenase beta subunit